MSAATENTLTEITPMVLVVMPYYLISIEAEPAGESMAW
jgi:hypothetical protein